LVYLGKGITSVFKVISEEERPTLYNPSMSDHLLSYAEASALVADYALARSRAQTTPVRTELAYATGRVLAAPLLSDTDQPPFARSTRDGFACRAAEAERHELLVIAGSTHAGQPPAGPLPPAAVWEIMTGAPIPAGADAVAMLEHVESQDGHVRLLPRRNLHPGKNIVQQGAQARAGDLLLAPGTVLGPAQIALAASCGAAHLSVFKRPRVAIITTGDELVAADHAPGPGQIRNSNAPMLAAMVVAAGGDPWVFPTVADNASAIGGAIKQAALPAAQADLLIFSGGVSAGKFDLVEPALAKEGAKFFFTGVRLQPGKPAVFGEILHSTTQQMLGFGDLLRTATLETQKTPLPFLGLPGNPVSTAVTFLLFGAPLLAALSGCPLHGPHFLHARLKAEVQGKDGLTRFLPAVCDFNSSEGGWHEVETIPMHGSGDLTALARSNCFVMVPEESESLAKGSLVYVLPH
jgi:molybdopterin molybdotransferase